MNRFVVRNFIIIMGEENKKNGGSGSSGHQGNGKSGNNPNQQGGQGKADGRYQGNQDRGALSNNKGIDNDVRVTKPTKK